VNGARALFEKLFGDRSAFMFFDKKKKLDGSEAEPRRSAFLKRIDDVLDSIDIVRRADGTECLVFCYWCLDAQEEQGSAAPAGPDPGQCCCTNDAEGRDKVAAKVNNFVFAAAWAVAAANRWGYILTVWRKILLLCLVNDSLTALLQGIRRSASVDVSMEQALIRAITENPEDISTKNQLKLVRLCKTLLNPRASLHMVLGVTVTGLLDALHYSILGRDQGKITKRACLLDLVDPDKSPVGRVQDQLVELADGFFPNGPEWFFLSILGVDFDSVPVRILARAALLRQNTGLIHHFGKLLAAFPTVLLLTLPEIRLPERTKREIAHIFVFLMPRECLPPSGKRLQDACSSIEHVFTVLRPALSVLGRFRVLATDNVERSHALVKQDVHSQTKARKGASAGKRVFCSQVPACHMERGGADPALPRLASAEPAGASKNNHPGSAKIRHRNHMMKLWKARCAPSRPMTRDEISAVREKANAEWDGISSNPEELQEWTAFNRGRSRESKAVRRGRGAADADATMQTVSGLWNHQHSGSSRIFGEADMVGLASAADEGEVSAAPAGADSADDYVDVAPARCVKTGEGWGPLWGCACKVKNICRVHDGGDRDVTPKMDLLLRHINCWVRALGKPLVEEVNSFIWFNTSARTEDGGSLDRICLLSDAFYQPVAQYFTYCHLRFREEPRGLDVPTTTPFPLYLGANANDGTRMRGAWREF